MLGEDANAVDLAPLVASLRAGAAWTEIAENLLNTAPALAALDNAAFVNTLFAATMGEGPPGAAEFALHTARLAGGAVTRAQLAVDIALSPAALARLAEAAPAGHWVADPFDPASGTPAHSSFDNSAPLPATPPPAAGSCDRDALAQPTYRLNAGAYPISPLLTGRAGPRACQSLSSALLLDPVHGGSHAEHAHEGARGLLVAGRDRTPLLEPGPEALGAVAVHVDPRRTGDRRLVALGRDRRTCAEAPNAVAKAWLA